MKKIIYASLIIFCAACSTATEKTEKAESANETKLVATKEYACPMHCEGEKTYAKAGQCPVCKMDLQELAMAETDSTAHEH